MKVLLPGYILLPLSPFLFFVKRRWLFYATVFFIPFSASAVVYFPSISFGLQIPYFWAMIWLSRLILDTIHGKMRPYHEASSHQYRIEGALILFLTIGALSLFVPQLGLSALVHPVEEAFHTHGVLSPSRTNLTQFAYMLFLAAFFLGLLVEVENQGKLMPSLRVFVLSAFFCELWGVFQYLCRVLHLVYPSYIFNNNPAFYQGWDQTIMGHIPRMCSVATEPSVFSGFLFAVIPLLAFSFFKRIKITRVDPLVLVLGLLCALLTFSTTALVGLVLLLAIGGFLVTSTVPWEKGLKITAGALTGGALILLLYLIFTSPLGYAFQAITLEKLSTASGLERLEGAKLGLHLAYTHPLLGVGWGSNRTFDLVTNLLSNVGILGTVSFFLFICLVCANSLKAGKDVPIYRGITLAICISLFLSALSIPDLIQMQFWFLLGIGSTLPSHLLISQTNSQRCTVRRDTGT